MLARRNGSGITDGCELPENTFYLTSDGSVLYNSTDAIGGFQFSVDGVNSVVSPLVEMLLIQVLLYRRKYKCSCILFRLNDCSRMWNSC